MNFSRNILILLIGIIFASCDGSKYAPEHFLSGTLGNEAYTITFDTKQGIISLRTPIGEVNQLYRNMQSKNGIIKIYCPSYSNSQRNIDQKENVMTFIVEGDNNGLV